VVTQNSDVDLTSGWDTIKNNVSMDQSSIIVPDVSTGDELPLIKDENGDQVRRILQLFFLVINLTFIVLDDANVLA
jgi:hypothetical protein